MDRKIELLAPAGSVEALKAAIHAGADAVYMGGSRFGARAFADNPEQDELLQAIDYAHLYQVSLYMTVNTLLKEEEIDEELDDFLRPYYEAGLDGVIVQDVGVLRHIRQNFPDLPIHASTQMTLTGTQGVRLLKKEGVSRVVLARELSLEEIMDIQKSTGMEVETFIHGALCYCYSGQCLLSSEIGGRSGNRGQCAQPCRMKYTSKYSNRPSYLLSLKDLETLEILPEIIEAGVTSLKIEGRMKKPEYVAAVTSIYRHYIDEYLKKGKKGYSVSPEDIDNLLSIYNRGGFTKGYYKQHNGADMLCTDRPNHTGVPALRVKKKEGNKIVAKTLRELSRGDVIEITGGKDNYTLGNFMKKGETLYFHSLYPQRVKVGEVLYRVRCEELVDSIKKRYLERKKQIPIQGVAILKVGEPAQLKVKAGNVEVTITGQEVERAARQPLEKEKVKRQLEKTGETRFFFQELTVELDEESFFPASSLNQLRRDGLIELEKAMLRPYRRKCTSVISSHKGGQEVFRNTSLPHFSVLVSKKEQLKVGLLAKGVTRIYIEEELIEEEELLSHPHQKEIYLAMPYVFRNEDSKYYEKKVLFGLLGKIDGFLVRNIEELMWVQTHSNLPYVLDRNMYAWNKEAQQFWLDNGARAITASQELNVRELSKLNTSVMEIPIYGYFPVMISANCIAKTMGKCSKDKSWMVLEDRFQNKMPVKKCCQSCYNVLYHERPLSLLSVRDEVMKLYPDSIRADFTLEDGKTCEFIVEQIRKGFFEKGEVEENWSSTLSHFHRGVR